LNRAASFFAFVLMANSLIAAAERPDDAATASAVTSSGAATAPTDYNPVAQVRQNKSLEFGPFINYGTGVGDRSDYKFFWAGIQMAKPLSPVVHAGVFSGQFEFGSNIMPLWQAYTPAPYTKATTCTESGTVEPCNLQYGGGTFRGVSLTPVIFRWNFLTRSRRFQPWFQAAGGLIYTTHKFPPNYMESQTIGGQPYTLDGGTSVWNFSPQGGLGFHYFTRAKRSIDVGVNAVHISSASLGDHNPGVNASIQMQLGYTFWK